MSHVIAAGSLSPRPLLNTTSTSAFSPIHVAQTNDRLCRMSCQAFVSLVSLQTRIEYQA